jgi:hemerythrin-like domain-containing protein
MFAKHCMEQPKISAFTDFLGVYSSEMDHLEKEEDDLAQVMAKKREVEEQNKLLSQLREDKNKQYNKSCQEKIAKVSAAVHDSPCLFAVLVHHICPRTFWHNSHACCNI